MKSDYSKQVKRVQKSIGILKLGDEIIEFEKKKRKRRTITVSQIKGVSGNDVNQK